MKKNSRYSLRLFLVESNVKDTIFFSHKFVKTINFNWFNITSKIDILLKFSFCYLLIITN